MGGPGSGRHCPVLVEIVWNGDWWVERVSGKSSPPSDIAEAASRAAQLIMNCRYCHKPTDNGMDFHIECMKEADKEKRDMGEHRERNARYTKKGDAYADLGNCVICGKPLTRAGMIDVKMHIGCARLKNRAELVNVQRETKPMESAEEIGKRLAEETRRLLGR